MLLCPMRQSQGSRGFFLCLKSHTVPRRVGPLAPWDVWVWYAAAAACTLPVFPLILSELKAPGRTANVGTRTLAIPCPVIAWCLGSSQCSIFEPSASESNVFCLWSTSCTCLEHCLDFSLQGIVCVKPTELKDLQRLLFPAPERQSCWRPFCILAAKRWESRVKTASSRADHIKLWSQRCCKPRLSVWSQGH